MTCIGKDLIWESNDVKLLGVAVDRDLKFYKHVLKLCSKANQKLSAPSRMANLLSFNKRRTLFVAFVEFQFKYCQLFRCFIVDVPTAKLIGYMREPLELFMMTTSQHSPSKYPETIN